MSVPEMCAFNPPQRTRILVADDEKVIADTLKLILTGAGYDVAVTARTVVTSSVLNGYVTELRAGTLKRMWTTKLAPSTRYVAISMWPR